MEEGGEWMLKSEPGRVLGSGCLSAKEQLAVRGRFVCP